MVSESIVNKIHSMGLPCG